MLRYNDVYNFLYTIYYIDILFSKQYKIANVNEPESFRWLYW